MIPRNTAMAFKLDVLTATATDLSEALNRGLTSSVQIVERYLDQIEKHNHEGLKLHAVIETAPRESVLAIAKRLDEERANGALRSPLHGIPLLVKDAYCTPSLGMKTTCGSFALANATAKANAKVIDKLLAAGLIIIAKAGMTELGNMKGFNQMAGWSAVGGQVQSPYVRGTVDNSYPFLTHTGPAGSSSGSGAGVAAGFAPFSLGTESDGSITMPAARAALYALKISMGTVDDTGVQPALRHFDCLGGLSRGVKDLAQLTAIMQDFEPDHYLPLRGSWDGLKIGFLKPSQWRWGPQVAEPVKSFVEQTEIALYAAAEKIKGLGAKVVLDLPMMTWEELQEKLHGIKLMEDLNPYQLKRSLGDFLALFEGGPKTIAELIEFNSAHSELEFAEHNDNQKLLEMARDDTTSDQMFETNMVAFRSAAANSVLTALKEFDLDVIVGPSDSRTGSFGAAAGFPVANMPLGFADFNGRGFSLHMIAPPKHEGKIFQVLSAWEATFPENVRPPPRLVEYDGLAHGKSEL